VRRLLTIPISHYCEKARWALERAGLEYREERHVQGVHRLVSRRAGGSGTLPVLVAPEGVFSQSEDILRYADAALDEEARLFPADPDLLTEVLALCRRLDEGLGPDGRRLMYARILPEKDALLTFNNQGVPMWEARMLTLFWRPLSRWAKRELSIHAETLAEDGPRVWRAFDMVAERLADGRPYLCGERFTAADLTFACLAAAVTVPPDYGVRLPQPEELPEPVARDFSAFREHPAGRFALELFRTRRTVAAGDPAPA
jgi:glutathione S-transferase